MLLSDLRTVDQVNTNQVSAGNTAPTGRPVASRMKSPAGANSASTAAVRPG